MAISVTQPIGAAIDRTGRILFKPFDAGKWFVLGFCAWLAYLGEGGSHFNFQVPGRGLGGPSGPFSGGEFDEIIQWFQAHAALIISLVALGFVLILAIGYVLTWVQSRGKFMFLDGVVRNRGAVVEPWRKFRALGNSLFWFRIVLGLIGLGVFALTVLVGLAIAWPDIQAERFSGMALGGIAAAAVIFIPSTLILAVIGLFLEHFVIPVMYLRGVRTMKAWGLFRHEILAGHVGPIVLFYLMKIALGIAIGIIALVATCITCCLAALPYLGTVILLPLFVFGRCYSLCFLEQFGESWRFFAEDEALPPPPPPPPGAPVPA